MSKDFYNFDMINTKDEDNLELSWGYWHADEEYNRWLITGNKRKKEPEQLELFSEENNYNCDV